MENHHHDPDYEPANGNENAAGCLAAFFGISIFCYLASQVPTGLLALGVIIGLVFLHNHKPNP